MAHFLSIHESKLSDKKKLQINLLALSNIILFLSWVNLNKHHFDFRVMERFFRKSYSQQQGVTGREAAANQSDATDNEQQNQDENKEQVNEDQSCED